MLKFPDVQEPRVVTQPRMSLKEYAEFSEFCLNNNPLITSDNCMERGEGISQPFSISGYKREAGQI